MNRLLLDNALSLGMLAICVLAAPLVTYAQSNFSRHLRSSRRNVGTGDKSGRLCFFTMWTGHTHKDEMEERHLPVPDTPVGWYRRGMQVLCGYKRTSGLSDHRGPRSIPRIAPALKYLPC